MLLIHFFSLSENFDVQPSQLRLWHWHFPSMTPFPLPLLELCPLFLKDGTPFFLFGDVSPDSLLHTLRISPCTILPFEMEPGSFAFLDDLFKHFFRDVPFDVSKCPCSFFQGDREESVYVLFSQRDFLI